MLCIRTLCGKAISAAYEPESIGRAERQVQAIKERATSMILHADMPRSFWSYDRPLMSCGWKLWEWRSPFLRAASRWQSVRLHAPEVFAPRACEGVYLCIEGAIQDASRVLVDTPQGVRFMTTRLPVTLAVEPKRL